MLPTALKRVPVSLTILRLALAPLIVMLARVDNPGWMLVACLTIALLSDIFDGVLARRLGVSTPILRRFDTATDVIFYLAVIWTTWIRHPEPIQQHALAIAGLIALEAICNIISLYRFRQPPATHTYLAKSWGLVLFAAFVSLLGFGYAGILFDSAIILGYVVDAEVIAILLVSRTAPVDVATLATALRD